MTATTSPSRSRTDPTRIPFVSTGKVPVATTIVLFTVVGALIAFIVIV